MGKKSCARSCWGVIQSVLVAAVLYGFLYLGVLVVQRGSFPKSPTDLYKTPGAHRPVPTSSVGSSTPSKLKVEKIIKNANWFNRPESLVVPKDDYMGKRPHVDVVANVTRMVHECRGSYENIEKMPYVQDCMDWLVNGQDEYMYTPAKADRESEQSPKHAEYLDADGKGNSLSEYPSYKAASKHSIGRCNGPIVPYHVYWTGPATWRVELFLKSYFYTQNLPCARVWLWLDGDRDPLAVEKMPNDPLFKKFMPYVERGDITLKLWRFPSRIPLPKGDNTDGVGYYKTPGKPNSKDETVVADGLIRDANDQEWLVLTEKQMTFLPVAVSDAVRFVVLHMYGGAYFDMDVVMLRDMRPLTIGPDHSFAERWGGHASPGDYNTAIMSLTANSSLSSYLLRGGVRMGLNFHPRIIGVMAVKDGRDQEFHMLETSAFDTIWAEFDGDRLGRCTVPCLHNYAQVFMGSRGALPLKNEWEAYEGEPLKLAGQKPRGHFWEIRGSEGLEERAAVSKSSSTNDDLEKIDKEALSKAEYKIELDNYPPTNRTMENFFKGAFTYHVHNQWLKNPEPSSWLNVVQRAQDGFFRDGRLNPYGEKWEGDEIDAYEHSWEYA